MEMPTVVVTGSVEREVDPDSFVLIARVDVRAADSAAAHAELAKRFAVLDQAAMALGADDVEIKRGAIMGYAEDVRTRRWIATRELTVICRDTSRAAEVAGALGRVSDVSIHGPHWQVDPANEVFAQVQTDAVRAARERAERYAAALGGELGRLVELRDGGGHMPMHLAAASVAYRGAPDTGLEILDLSPQPQTVHAMVEARWYLVLPA